jgi:DNA-binding LytR/AlgR family response regulator
VDFSTHRVVLHSRQGGTTVVRIPFSQMESLLCAYPYFFCPTKGMIVNFYEVAAQNGNTFALRDGTIVPISRRKAKEALDAYASFLFRQLRKGGNAACRPCTD